MKQISYERETRDWHIRFVVQGEEFSPEVIRQADAVVEGLERLVAEPVEGVRSKAPSIEVTAPPSSKQEKRAAYLRAYAKRYYHEVLKPSREAMKRDVAV